MSETSRTDEIVKLVFEGHEYVAVKFAHKLERELNHAIRGRDQGLDFILAMREDNEALAAELATLKASIGHAERKQYSDLIGAPRK